MERPISFEVTREITPSLPTIRRIAFEEFKNECVKCKNTKTLQLDHIIPICLGGSATDLANTQILCKQCHKKKTRIDRKIRGVLYTLSILKKINFHTTHYYLPKEEVLDYYHKFTVDIIRSEECRNSWIKENAGK